jgi:cytoskeletal protein RodZ
MTDKENIAAGEMLRRARTTGRRKRELQTIAKQLCIKEEFLEALESCEYGKIPELVYALGFARNYAMELDLDPDVVVAKIKEELGIVREEDEEHNSSKTSKKAISGGKGAMSSASAKAGAFIRRNWKRLSAIIVSAGLTALVVWGVSEFVARRAPVPAAPVEVAVNSPNFSVPVKEEFGVTDHAARVVLQATQESWIKMEDAQGETLFSRVLVAGDVYYVPEGDIRGTFGNAGGIEVWVDGALAPKLGPDHARKAGVVMTPEALMPESINAKL